MAKTKSDTTTEPAVELTADEQIAKSVGRNPTASQTALAAFILDKAGVEVDPKVVQVVQVLSRFYRENPDNKAAREQRKAERANLAATVDQRRQAKREARAAKLQAEAEAILNGEKRGPGRPKANSAQVTEPANEGTVVTPTEPVEADDF